MPRAQVGAWLLIAQPLVIASEMVVASRWDLPYDATRNTISDLGAVTCTTISAAYGPVAVCSPWHVLMNATFLVIGLALAVGAVLSRHRLPGLVVGLLAVAGLSSASVGLVPLDTHGGLHTLVATPLFVLQPLALLGAAVAARRRRGWATVFLVAGAVAAVGGVWFVATLVTGDVGGLAERVALWPCHLGVAAVGASLVCSRVWETGPMEASDA